MTQAGNSNSVGYSMILKILVTLFRQIGGHPRAFTDVTVLLLDNKCGREDRAKSSADGKDEGSRAPGDRAGSIEAHDSCIHAPTTTANMTRATIWQTKADSKILITINYMPYGCPSCAVWSPVQRCRCSRLVRGRRNK